jgi:hypothetical protein
VLAYSTSVVTAPVFPGERAWVSIRAERARACPFCTGFFDTYALEVRSTRGGPLLFIELSGGFPRAPSEEVLAQVFGAELREVPLCQYELQSGCEVVTRRPLDLAVGTVPEQLLRHAEACEVTSSSGDRFDVLVSWSADQVAIVPPNCADVSPMPRDRTFVASRLQR